MTEATKRLAFVMGRGLLGAVFALGAACGGSSGGSRTGTGGATGSGGAIGTGGTPATGGTTGTGGSGAGTGGATGFTCVPPVAATATLTDFSDWNPTTGRWGTTPGITGRVFGYHGAASTHTAMVDPVAGVFHLAGTVMPATPTTTNDGYIGGGLQFDTCATVASFSGVQFTVAGTTGLCALEVQLQPYSDRPTTQNPAGGCTPPGCSSPVKRNLATSGPVTVMFSELTGGVPSAFLPAELVQIQWQLTIPPGVDGGIQIPCTVDLTLDNVKFVN